VTSENNDDEPRGRWYWHWVNVRELIKEAVKVVWLVAPIALSIALLMIVMSGARDAGAVEALTTDLVACKDARAADARAVIAARPPLRGFGRPEQECPNFVMLQRDAQLDAAYQAGWGRCVDRNEELGLGRALRDCTERLMVCRNPVMPVLPVPRTP